MKSNGSGCKEFSYPIWSIFLVIQIVLEPSLIKIYYIVNGIVIFDLSGVFVSIINVKLLLFLNGYNSPAKEFREVEYHISDKDSLDWCVPTVCK